MAKRLVLDALRSGYGSVEVRGALSEKNLLGSGTVSGEQRARLIASCGGDRYAASPHHRDPEIECNIFRPVDPLWIEWYVKVYFIDERAVFISVHPARP